MNSVEARAHFTEMRWISEKNARRILSAAVLRTHKEWSAIYLKIAEDNAMPDIPTLQEIRVHAESAMARAADEFQSAKLMLTQIDDAIAAKCQTRRSSVQRIIIVGAFLLIACIVVLSIRW